MASACTTSCALASMQPVMADIDAGTTMNMDNCHEAMPTAILPDSTKTSSDAHKHQTEQKNCNMAGCHFTQVPPAISPAYTFLVDVSESILPRSNEFGVSADLSPPIKPPA